MPPRLDVFRIVYDHLPATVPMPDRFHRHHVEVIIQPLGNDDQASQREGRDAASPLSRFAGAWQGEPLVREDQGHYEIRDRMP